MLHSSNGEPEAVSSGRRDDSDFATTLRQRLVDNRSVRDYRAAGILKLHIFNVGKAGVNIAPSVFSTVREGAPTNPAVTEDSSSNDGRAKGHCFS